MGCVFFGLASFVARGPEGVDQFSKKRITTIGPVTDGFFYVGIKTEGGFLTCVKKEVFEWKVELQEGNGGGLSLILDIARSMLKIKPEERPTAELVREQLDKIISRGNSIVTALPEYRSANRESTRESG